MNELPFMTWLDVLTKVLVLVVELALSTCFLLFDDDSELMFIGDGHFFEILSIIS
jgi:hypothetical protein